MDPAIFHPDFKASPFWWEAISMGDDPPAELPAKADVVIVGGGASAMDNAATALEAGAASLDLFVRRRELPRVNKFTGIGSQGVVHGFEALPDDWKWRFLDYATKAQTPPPRDSALRRKACSTL